MSKLNWNKLPNQPEFDRVVEAFFMNENADLGADAYAVNGRGGDAGIDIHIRRDGRLNIVQLKFFPEGFSGGWTDRRKQILKSFKSALQHDPDDWTLVIPATLTHEERKYVTELPLRQRPPLTKPVVTVFDQPKLDMLAAKHADLVTYFTRDEIMDAVRTLNQEKALLVDTDDLTERFAALVKQGDSLDPDWRVVPTTHDGVVGTTFVAKNAQAAERSPIILKLSTEFGPDHAELKESFEKFMAFGAPDRIDLPADVVKAFKVEGPPAFAKESESGEVTFAPAVDDHESKPFTVVFYDGDRRAATFPGTTSWVGSAQLGASVRATFYNALTINILLPFDKSEPVNLSLNLSFAGREPAEVARAVTLLEHLHSGYAPAFELEDTEVARLLPADPDQAAFGQDLPEIFTHKGIAEDLIVVQEKTSLYFPYPDHIPSEDRLDLRCLRLLLEGKCIVMPAWNEFNMTLDGQDNEGLRKLLTSPQPARIQTEGFGYNLFGHDVIVGTLGMYSPQMKVVNPDSISDALVSNTAEGMTLTIRTVEGYGVWAFLPDRYVADADGKVCPVSLGLAGVPDAPDIARAREADAVDESPKLAELG